MMTQKIQVSRFDVVILIELETPIQGFQSACIPRPSFDDVGSGGKLAGYGLYHRAGGTVCQTNQFGKYKYHYCKSNASCQIDDVPEDKECKNFFKKNSERCEVRSRGSHVESGFSRTLRGDCWVGASDKQDLEAFFIWLR